VPNPCPNVSDRGGLGSELGDKVTVIRTPPGGGARISQDLWIDSIELSASNDGGPMTCKVGVSPV
jgi:hypothetical protein